jgi:RNA polymerase sigma-70 factor (ECF subfamily)
MVRFPSSRYLENGLLRLLKRESPWGVGEPVGAGEPVDELRALVVEVLAGRKDACQTLTAAIAPALLRTVRGVLGALHPDVEDVLQEALVAVHRALPDFRGESRTLHFACRIAVHTAMNARRKAGYRARHTPSVDPDELAELACDERSPARAYAEARRRAALRALLDELPAPQAEALVLHTVLGYSIDETVSAMGAPRDTVRSRLRGALGLLRERVADDPALFDALRGEP